MSKKVVILGGGVAGMSAAHELIERGFNVEVYEWGNIPGGKARSMPVFESIEDRGDIAVHGPAVEKWHRLQSYKLSVKDPQPWLPGEHGFRFFPGFYRHIIDTMERIPYGQGKVSDNLVNTSQCLLARFGPGDVILPSRFPRTLTDVKTVLEDFIRVFAGNIVPLHEAEFFGARIWQIITSCEERRLQEYEKIGWWDFIGAEERSPDFRKLFGQGITRSLVASQAHLASTWTIGNIFVQLLFDIADATKPTSDRLLNGPSNVVWIGPWLDYLESHGAKYEMYRNVESINCWGGIVRSVTIKNRQDGSKREVKGDYYVAALPVEQIAPMITRSLIEADPRLGHLRELAKNVAWMNGIQFYICRPLPITHGHVIYVDTPWALTSVSQGQFWSDFDLSKFSDGDTRDVLSVDVSDWTTPGLNGKIASDCTRDEFAKEVWEQLKRSINQEGQEILRDEDLDYWFLDPDIQLDSADELGFENIEPLLVNLKDTWRLRPDAVTAIPNLFLASDYVRTYTDLATMEAANEAARRAVNGILEASGSRALACRLWKLHEPELFQPLREYDRIRWESGLPWDDRLMSMALSVLEVVQKQVGFSSDETGLLSHQTALPIAAAIPSQLSTKRGNNEAENLLQISQQLLSMVKAAQPPRAIKESNQKEKCGSQGSRLQEAESAATTGLPRRRGRIRIVQNE